MTADGPRWDKIEAALSDGERDALLVVCRGLELDPRHWGTCHSLRRLFVPLALDRLAEAILTEEAEKGVHQARLLAGEELVVEAEHYYRQVRRWQDEQRQFLADLASMR